MIRNKNQGQQGLDDNRLDNQGDNRQNNKTPNRDLQQDEQRQGGRKNLKGGNTRKGGLGKDQ